MATNGVLTPKQNKAITALLSERNKRAAAEAAGVGYRTLCRWMTDPSFTRALNQAEAEVISTNLRGLINDMDKNLEAMREIRNNPDVPEAVRLRAAQALDASTKTWHEVRTFESRLAALEAAIYGKNR